MKRPKTGVAGDEFARMFAEAGLPSLEPASKRTRGQGPYRCIKLSNAHIIDGTGAPPWGPADIIVADGRIVSGENGQGRAARQYVARRPPRDRLHRQVPDAPG